MFIEIKSFLHIIIQNLENIGLFYEYGIVKSLSIILIYSSITLYLIKGSILAIIEKQNLFELIIINLLGSLFAFLYYKNIILEDLGFFYPPTTNQRINNIYILSIIFGISQSLYYKFYRAINEDNKIIANLVMASLMTSPLQLWVLYSSSTRDFLRGPILALYFLLVIKVIRKQIAFDNNKNFVVASILIFCMSFRQEIYLYFPILFLAIIIFNDESRKKNIYIISKIILFFIPGYYYLTGGMSFI